MVPVLLLAAGGLTLGGCQVSQSKYDELLGATNALKTRNLELTDENTALRSSLDELRRGISNGGDAAGEAMAMNVRLRQENESLLRRLQDMDARLSSLSMQPVVTALDTQTDSVLKTLADQFPGILSYDSQRGMLRFTSDVTFASGSFELTDAGRRAVREVGRVLNATASADQYEISVVGHTDTQPVTLREGRRFRDNAELSSFRALSVRNELIGAGIAPYRVEFAGFGETRPAVANSASGNTPANRRVEVYLLRNTYSGLTAAPVRSRQVAPAAPRTTPSGGASPRPAGEPAAPTPVGGGGGSDIEIVR
jgi:chemotaxis protein MotB